MTGPAPRLSVLDHLTLLEVAPPRFVEIAAAAGFGAVGLRVAPATAGEQPWPMAIGSAMLADTLTRLADTGLRVLDVEAVRLAGDQDGSDFEPVLATAAALGASYLNVIVDDTDLPRLAERFAALVRRAEPFGVRPFIEFMAYKPVRSLAAAISVVGDSGGGILLDALHLQRCGTTGEEVARLDPSLLTYVQLCDGPRTAPLRVPAPRLLPRGQRFDGDPLALEARTQRLLPGEGEFPLLELLAALPATLPVAVEAPNLVLAPAPSPAERASAAYRSLERMLATANSAGRQGATGVMARRGGPDVSPTGC